MEEESDGREDWLNFAGGVGVLAVEDFWLPVVDFPERTPADFLAGAPETLAAWRLAVDWAAIDLAAVGFLTVLALVLVGFVVEAVGFFGAVLVTVVAGFFVDVVFLLDAAVGDPVLAAGLVVFAVVVPEGLRAVPDESDDFLAVLVGFLEVVVAPDFLDADCAATGEARHHQRQTAIIVSDPVTIEFLRTRQEYQRNL
ncbi:MAG: hypothetical protein ACKV19_20875 [Verrucomicrobiales bacterium]